MRARRIRLDGNTGTSPRERDNGAPRDSTGARAGPRIPDTRTLDCHIQFNAAGRARNRGMRPMEAAEVNPVHSGKRHALVWNAADHNNAPGSAQ